MKRRLACTLALLAFALAYGCGTPPTETARGEAVARPTQDPGRATSTPVALPTPTPAEAPRLRARGIITAIDDASLTFRDIDGNELKLKASPALRFPWAQLRELHQSRSRITVVYQQAPEGLLLVDVFPS